MIHKKSKIKYKSILESINAEYMGSFADCKNVDSKNVCILRHDIDHSMDKALKFAKYEYEIGVTSTYFLLHTASYFDYSDRLANKCWQLVDMGHEIGFHNDLLSVTYHRVGITRSIKAFLNFFKNIDIPIHMTASHGSGNCYKKKFYNYEIWEEFEPKKNEGFCTLLHDKIALDEYGLEEAYFTDYNFYLSDTKKGKWRGLVVDQNKPKPFERTLLNSKNNIGLDVLEEYKGRGTIQILTHPIHWADS